MAVKWGGSNRQINYKTELLVAGEEVYQLYLGLLQFCKRNPLIALDSQPKEPQCLCLGSLSRGPGHEETEDENMDTTVMSTK